MILSEILFLINYILTNYFIIFFALGGIIIIDISGNNDAIMMNQNSNRGYIKIIKQDASK